MKPTLFPAISAPRLLLAAGLLAAGIAQAASGYVIASADESAVKTGMSMAEVRQVLGHPYREAKFPTEPGLTWTYQVNTTEHGTLFDVDFSADGHVVSIEERFEQPR